MAFHVEVVFTGLCLVCLEGQQPCGDQSRVYLLNALDPQNICHYPMDGDHRPLLAFNEKHLLPGATMNYTLEPLPNGDRSIVAPLHGKDICLRTETQDGNSKDLMTGRPTPKGLRIDHWNHPQWFMSDGEDYDWIAYLFSVEKRVDDHKYCPQLQKPPASNEYITGRVRLDGGTIMTRNCAHTDAGWMKRLFAMDYIEWEVTGEPGSADDFPKALPDQVVWRTEKLSNETTVLIETCGTSAELPQTLFRLFSRGKNIEVHVSNLPATSMQSSAGPHLEHFRWYYRLLDWNDDDVCDSSADECPRDVSLPTLPGNFRFAGDDMWGVISGSVHCPPGGSGSP